MELSQINLKRIEKLSLIYGIAVALLVAISLYIRVALPYDSVFTNTFVRFGGNDPWYNMRIVENTLHNFPHRIYYDAYTYYPYGSVRRASTLLALGSLRFWEHLLSYPSISSARRYGTEMQDYLPPRSLLSFRGNSYHGPYWGSLTIT